MKGCPLIFVLSLSIVIIFLSLLSGVEENSKITPFVIYEIVEQCEDGIQNYDETGIDCGGSCAACPVVDDGGTGGGGGGGGGGSIIQVVTEPTINETKSVEVSIPGLTTVIKDFDIGTGIKQIQIEVKTEVQNLSITVSKYDGRPEEVTELSGRVYRYLKIDVENLGDNLEKATITFQVEKSWISDNSLEKEDIAMFEFDADRQSWEELATVYTESDDVYHYYEVELDSFSYFAIGEKEALKVRSVVDIFEKNLIWIILGVVLVIIGIIVYVKRRKALEGELN